MKESDFDKSIRDMMESYGESPEPTSWDSIEHSLASGRRMIIFLRSVSAVAAVAAVVALFLIIGKDAVKEQIKRPVDQIAVVENRPESTPVAIEKSQGIADQIQKKTAIKSKTQNEPKVILNNDENFEEENAPQKLKKTDLSPQEEKVDNKPKEVTRTSPAQPAEQWNFPIEEQIKSKRRKPSLAFSTLLTPGVGSNERILNTYMQSDFMQFTSSLDRQQSQIETVYDTKYLPAVSVGLQLMVPLSRMLSIATGLNYTMLYSATEEQRFNETVTREQTLHYIGLPLYLYANIFSGEKLMLYGGAGATVEKGLAERVERNGVLPLDETNPVSGLQWSAGATVGGEYRLGKHMGLYADPMLVYYFRGNQPKSIRSVQPLQFKLELGLRYRF